MNGMKKVYLCTIFFYHKFKPMKRLFLFISLSFLALNLFGQTETFHVAKKNTIGVHVAPYDFIGIDRFNVDYSYMFGLDYSRGLTDRWSFCTGLEQRLFVQRAEHRVFDNIDKIKHKGRFIDLPIAIRYYFSYPVYLQFGQQFTFYINEKGMGSSSLSYHELLINLGWQLSVGWEYELNNGILLSFNPGVRWYFPHNSGNSNEALNGFRSFASKGFSFFCVNMGIGYKF